MRKIFADLFPALTRLVTNSWILTYECTSYFQVPTPIPWVNYKIVLMAPWLFGVHLQRHPDLCLLDPDPNFWVSYPIKNWSIDYIELPASFFHLKMPSQFSGHLLFPLSSNTSPLITSESESEVAQSRPTLCDPMDYSPPGSSVHGILQARILEWVAIFFSRVSSQPRDRTQVSCNAGRRFNLWATREAHWSHVVSC